MARRRPLKPGSSQHQGELAAIEPTVLKAADVKVLAEFAVLAHAVSGELHESRPHNVQAALLRPVRITPPLCLLATAMELARARAPNRA